MIRLLNFIIEIRDAITLVICLLISFVLLITTDNDPGTPFRRIALKSIGGIGGYFYQVSSYFNLRDEVRELREKNAELSFENMQLQDALLENIRLRKALEFKENTPFELIAAEIVGENPHAILSGFILNEGQKRGIEKFDAVLTADGLVGKIVTVEEDYSICQIIFDRNSRVSAKIQRNRELGVIAWDGGANLNMLYIAKTIEVKPGDVIVTSGYSQIFPENIKIGVVSEYSMETEGMFQEIRVQPAVNFRRLEEVHIVKMRNSDASRAKL